MIKRRPRAIYAIIEIAEYIGQNSPASAERFMDATEAAFAQLEATPGMGHLYDSFDIRLANVRVWSMKGFPNHLIFYRPSEAGIEIIHVLHGARDISAVLAEEMQKGAI